MGAPLRDRFLTLGSSQAGPTNHPAVYSTQAEHLLLVPVASLRSVRVLTTRDATMALQRANACTLPASPGSIARLSRMTLDALFVSPCLARLAAKTRSPNGK